MTPIIRSLLDTDLYKFTMWQAMLHRHPQAQAEYRFVCRNASAFPLAELLPEVDEQLTTSAGSTSPKTSWPTWAGCATSNPTSSTFSASSASSAASSRRAQMARHWRSSRRARRSM